MKLPQIVIGGSAPFYWKAEVVDADGHRSLLPFTALRFELGSDPESRHGKLVLEIPGHLVRIDDELRVALDHCSIIVKKEA